MLRQNTNRIAIIYTFIKHCSLHFENCLRKITELYYDQKNWLPEVLGSS